MKKKQTKKVTRSKEAIKDLSPTAKQEKGVKGGRMTWDFAKNKE